VTRKATPDALRRSGSAGPAHVAIVGCGFTGTSTLFQLVDRYPVKHITVFESSGVFGPGYPYRTDECRDYLLNNTTDTMCLVPENKRGFVNWLRDTGVAGAVEDKSHLPRALFGEFLGDTVRTARTIAAIKGIALNLIPAEVLALNEVGDGVEIIHDGGSLSADLAVLTTGRRSHQDRFRDTNTEAPGDARFFSTHVSSAGMDSISLDASVYVMGTSLSAYDVVNRLFAATTGCAFQRQQDGSLRYLSGPNKRRVVLGSRGGRLKKVQSERPIVIKRKHFTLSELRRLATERRGLTLETLAGLVKTEAERHAASIDWAGIADPYAGCKDAETLNKRAGRILASDIAAARDGNAANFLIDFFADAQMDIWDGFAERLMEPAEEKRYRADWETAFLSFGAPCPIPTAERLLALHDAGVLTVRAGVQPPTRSEDGNTFSVAHRFGEDIADVVIDASGSVNRLIADPDQPALTAHLVRTGLMQGYQLAGDFMPGAHIDMKTLRPHGSQHIYALNMWLWGPGFYTSSAFLMASLARRLLDRLFLTQNDEH
jgi:hypothetical protein